MRRLLITGAGGFIGSHIIEKALGDQIWKLHAVVSGQRQHNFTSEVTVHIADLSKAEDCEELLQRVHPDTLIHLAWSLDEKDYAASDSNLRWMENSLRLLRLFYQYGGRRFLFAGSASEYCEPGGRFSEYALPVQRSVYGESKLAFEMVSKRYCERNGYEFVSARCFPVYGEGDIRKFKAIGAAITAFLKNEQFVCKGPNNVWDYIHVEDTANALLRIAESEYCGVVNVGTGRPHLMRDVFTTIAKKMDSIELLSFSDNLEHVTVQVADPIILNQKIGYSCKVEFNNGLDRTIAWWRAQSENK